MELFEGDLEKGWGIIAAYGEARPHDQKLLWHLKVFLRKEFPRPEAWWSQ